MRRILTVLMILASGLMTNAQPLFSNTNCYQLGDSSRLGFALVLESFDGFIPQTGNNFTWDFSGTGFPGPWGTWTAPTIPYVFQPSALSTHVPFQSTQINEYSNVAGSRDHFFSYSPASDTLYYHGYYTGGTSYIYYLPLPYLVFPMNFGDSMLVSLPILNATGAVQTGTVTRSWKYDGFGTVKLPYGIENNVYRIHAKQVDSLMINGIFISATTEEELIWIKQSDGIPVLRFQKQGSSNLYAWYASATGSTSVSEIPDSNPIHVYPNPSSDFIKLRSESPLIGLHYEIVDNLGRISLTGNLVADNQILDIRHLDPGHYFISLGGSTPRMLKIMKK